MNIVHRTEYANSVDLIIFRYNYIDRECSTAHLIMSNRELVINWNKITRSFEFFYASSFSTPSTSNVKPIKTFYNAKFGKYLFWESQKIRNVYTTGELCQLW